MKPVLKTIEMTKAQWTKWDKALRDGKIKQGVGKLCNSDGTMCCLGVLEYALEGKVEDTAFPTKEFRERNGIVFRRGDGSDTHNPFLGGGYASMLNDGDEAAGIKKRTFKQIANLIRQRVKFISPKRAK